MRITIALLPALPDRINIMPTKLKTQRKAQAAKQDPCCVCLQKFYAKDEILFCSGSCQRFLHRYCASVSEQALANADPFLCYCCFRSQKEAQIESLKCIESLKAEIDALKARPVSPVVDRGKTLCSSFSNVATMSNTSLNHERKYKVQRSVVPAYQDQPVLNLTLPTLVTFSLHLTVLFNPSQLETVIG